MKAALGWIWLWALCVIFIGAISAILIGILFAIGHEADGYNATEKFGFAIRYGSYIGGVFGTLLALMIGFRNWRIARRNRKIQARKTQT